MSPLPTEHLHEIDELLKASGSERFRPWSMTNIEIVALVEQLRKTIQVIMRGE
jgi:hypothetical protein